jgi:hypothetical protein
LAGHIESIKHAFDDAGGRIAVKLVTDMSFGRPFADRLVGAADRRHDQL